MRCAHRHPSLFSNSIPRGGRMLSDLLFTCSYTYFLETKKARFAPSSMMVFDLNPFKPVTFSSTAKNKVTKKKPLAGLCSSSNYLQDLAGRRNVLPALCDSICIPAN